MPSNFVLNFIKKTKQEAYAMLNEAYGMNKWAKQVSIDGLTGFLKEMNRLKIRAGKKEVF